jgi:preprotein translocase subunit SecE
VATARGQRGEPVDRGEPGDRQAADRAEAVEREDADGGAVEREAVDRDGAVEPSEPVDESPEALRHATPDVELAEAQLAIGRPEPGDIQPAGDEEEGFEDVDDAQARGTQLSSRAETAPAPRGASRLVHFLQGSWRELQRVQWPDRRQVMQATGVVIGFVIVAGLFLGAADWAAQKIVTFILK